MAEVPSDAPIDAASLDGGGLHATMDAAISKAAKKGRRLSATFAARADQMAVAKAMLAAASAEAATKGEAHTAEVEARAAHAAHHGSDAKALATAAAFGGHGAGATALNIGKRVKTFAGEGVVVSENANDMWAVKLDWKLAQGQKVWGIFHASALEVVQKKRKKKLNRIPSMNRRSSAGPAPGPPPMRPAAPVGAAGSSGAAVGASGAAVGGASDGARAAETTSAKPAKLAKSKSVADILGTLLLKKKRRVRRMSALGEDGHHRDMEGVLEKLATPLGVINLFPRWQERFFKVKSHYLMYKCSGEDDEWLGGVDLQGDDAAIVLANNVLTVRGLCADMHDGTQRNVRVLRVRHANSSVLFCSRGLQNDRIPIPPAGPCNRFAYDPHPPCPPPPQLREDRAHAKLSKAERTAQNAPPTLGDWYAGVFLLFTVPLHANHAHN